MTSTRRKSPAWGIAWTIAGALIIAALTSAVASEIGTRDLAKDSVRRIDTLEERQGVEGVKLEGRLMRMESQELEHFEKLLDKVEQLRIELNEAIQSLRK